MRFELASKYDDDNSWFDKTIGDKFNKLSEKDKQRINDLLAGDTDKIVDPKKFRVFVESIVLIKEFFNAHTTGYTVNIDQKKGIINLVFDCMIFEGADEIAQIFSRAKHVTLTTAVSSQVDRVEIIAEYDITSELK